MLSSLNNKTESNLIGNRHFWCSDLMTHQRENFYVSTRMHSKRIFNTDGLINEEGRRSHYIADGSNYIFRTGDEYKNIFPVWDWQRIPGITIELKNKRIFPNSPQRKGNTLFVGGVSDGMYGLTSLDFKRDELVAHKSWFYFDNEIVCLGAGIDCTTDNKILTTINQCHLRGDVTVINDDKKIVPEKGTHKYSSTTLVYLTFRT